MTTNTTRAEHIAWCKKRAIQEMEFSHDPKDGVVSMMSDIRKHPETDSETLTMLCMMTLMGPCTEQSVRKFIDGFNQVGIDYSGFAIPKGDPRVVTKRKKRLSDEDAERECRKEVWRLYGRKCNVPGCKEKAVHQHHIVYRSKSRRLKYAPENRAPLCQAHHELEHAGKITIHPRTSDGELLVTGEKKYLEFKL